MWNLKVRLNLFLFLDQLDETETRNVIPTSVLSSQQAFNATAVIRHMRRLQLGTSFGSSIHGGGSSGGGVSNPLGRGPAKSQSVDCAPLSLQDCE